MDTRCHENKAPDRAGSVYISTSLGLGHVCCSEPRFPGIGQDKARPFPQALGQVGCRETRFPGLGQDKARPKSVYTVKMLAKAGSVNTTIECIRAHYD